MSFEKLFEPLQVGTMTVPNRIVETTYSINSGRADGLPDAPFIAHHLARAQGGAGWIGNETWLLPTPLPPGRQDEILPGTGAVRFAVYELPEFVPRVRVFVDAVHQAGAVCVFQLTHLQNIMCPSSVQTALADDVIPRPLDEGEIEFILDTYWQAAVQLHAAGADAVEIHCAHETLPQLFLSPYTNRRTDAWGGSEEHRVRFVVEAVRRIRAHVPPTLNVGLRLCADEARADGYDLPAMTRMARRMCDAVAIDYLSVDMGSPWGRPSYVPPMQYPVATFAPQAAAIRKAVPVPVLCAGRVNDPAVAERLLVDGVADLVGMTRALLADPEMPRKARAGRTDEIRKCIGCNTCIGTVIHAEVKVARCAVNPGVGREIEWGTVASAPRAKRVVVVGGGPGGIETALIAAARGHRVTLLEREPALGGLLQVAGRAPERQAFLDYPRWAVGELARRGVTVELNTVASAASVRALAADAVVIATGGRPRPAEFPGADGPTVVQFADVLTERVDVGHRVVVVSEDDHMITPSVADFLASRGHQVEILHKWLMIAEQVERYTKGIVFQRLYAQGVTITPSTRVRAVAAGTVTAYNVHTGTEHVLHSVDPVVLCLGALPNDALYAELRAAVPEIHLVGSAFAPRGLAEATLHGASVGRLL